MTVATETEACREYARNVGAEDQDREWILTSFDTWEHNPFYTGPRGRHPEDDGDEVFGPFLPATFVGDEIPF